MHISLIGYGSHGRDIEVIFHRCRHTWLDIYDDDPSIAPPIPDDLKGRIIVGVNDPVARSQIADRYPHLRGCRPLVDPSAVIDRDVHLGRGVVVAPHATLLHHVTVGEHSHINYNACMTRCSIGYFCTISPGAVLCGNVDIGDETTIGAGAIVCERTTIGSRVTVGAGAIIPPRSTVPDGVTVVGVWKG